MEEGQKFIRAAMKDLKKKEKSEIERLKAENARLRDVLSAAMENIRNADYAVALAKIEHALEQ